MTNDRAKFDVKDLFDYCYASLFSSAYRTKYKTELSIDFPRAPIPVSRSHFSSFVQLGKNLRELHLLEIPVENKLDIQFIGVGEGIVSAPRYYNNRTYINQTQYFDNVREDLWDFCFGGYHGMQKWLKDRTQSRLSYNDINYIIRVFNLFDRTESIMAEIDSQLNMYGLL